MGMYSPRRLYARWRLQHRRYTSFLAEVAHQTRYQFVARLGSKVIRLPLSKFVDRQSWTIGIIIPGKNTERLRALQVKQLSPERTGINTLEGTLGNHYLIAHFPGPGIKLLDVYPQ